METIRLAHNTESTQIKNKIPEYARDFKREWLFIRGINKICDKFIESLDNINDVYEEEEVFYKPLAINLMNYFSRFLRYQKNGYAKNISEIYFKEEDIENILDLRIVLYGIVVRLNESDFFQDFFESFIVFNYNIKTKEFSENDSESESESDIDINEILTDSDSDSD